MRRFLAGFAVPLVVLALAGFAVVGCGSSDASATKQDEANFRNRDSQAIHPPTNAGPSGPPAGASGPTGAPPGAAGPPPGTK